MKTVHRTIDSFPHGKRGKKYSYIEYDVLAEAINDLGSESILQQVNFIVRLKALRAAFNQQLDIFVKEV